MNVIIHSTEFQYQRILGIILITRILQIDSIHAVLYVKSTELATRLDVVITIIVIQLQLHHSCFVKFLFDNYDEYHTIN